MYMKKLLFLLFPVVSFGQSKFTIIGGGGVANLNLEVYEDPVIKAYQTLGSVIKAETFNMATETSGTNGGLDGTIVLAGLSLGKDQTLTGIKYYLTTTGSFTGDNNNKIGLYTYSGGTFTKVAESSNSTSLWTGSTGIRSGAFTSTYFATKGVYFVAMLYNQSAQTTAPAFGIATGTSSGYMGGLDFTNGVSLNMTLGGQTDLPATISAASMNQNTIRWWLSIY